MVNIMEKENGKDDKKQEEQKKLAYIDGLLHVYQEAVRAKQYQPNSPSITGIINSTIIELSWLVNIVEKKEWYKFHPHEAFPDIDIRMLAFECTIESRCPFLLSVLKKIGMSANDYRNYKQRAGNMITMEHKRKMGKK